MPAFIFVRKNFFCLLASFPLSIDVRVDVGLFSPKRGGFETTGGHRRGGGTLTARLNSHKISFWKRKTASQKINIFFIRRKGEKSRGGEEGSFCFVKKTRLTLYRADRRAEYWGGLKFYSCGGGWLSVGSNPALVGEKVAHRREHHRLKKGMTRGDQRKRIFFHKDKCGHNKPLYFFWASHSSTKNSCFLVKEWAWTPALKNIV